MPSVTPASIIFASANLAWANWLYAVLAFASRLYTCTCAAGGPGESGEARGRLCGIEAIKFLAGRSINTSRSLVIFTFINAARDAYQINITLILHNRSINTRAFIYDELIHLPRVNSDGMYLFDFHTSGGGIKIVGSTETVVRSFPKKYCVH